MFVRDTAHPRARVHGKDAASRPAGTLANINGHPGPATNGDLQHPVTPPRTDSARLSSAGSLRRSRA
jgi:hypothetical protein